MSLQLTSISPGVSSMRLFCCLHNLSSNDHKRVLLQVLHRSSSFTIAYPHFPTRGALVLQPRASFIISNFHFLFRRLFVPQPRCFHSRRSKALHAHMRLILIKRMIHPPALRHLLILSARLPSFSSENFLVPIARLLSYMRSELHRAE